MSSPHSHQDEQQIQPSAGAPAQTTDAGSTSECHGHNNADHAVDRGENTGPVSETNQGPRRERTTTVTLLNPNHPVIRDAEFLGNLGVRSMPLPAHPEGEQTSRIRNADAFYINNQAAGRQRGSRAPGPAQRQRPLRTRPTRQTSTSTNTAAIGYQGSADRRYNRQAGYNGEGSSTQAADQEFDHSEADLLFLWNGICSGKADKCFEGDAQTVEMVTSYVRDELIRKRAEKQRSEDQRADGQRAEDQRARATAPRAPGSGRRRDGETQPQGRQAPRHRERTNRIRRHSQQQSQERTHRLTASSVQRSRVSEVAAGPLSEVSHGVNNTQPPPASLQPPPAYLQPPPTYLQPPPAYLQPPPTNSPLYRTTPPLHPRARVQLPNDILQYARMSPRAMTPPPVMAPTVIMVPTTVVAPPTVTVPAVVTAPPRAMAHPQRPVHSSTQTPFAVQLAFRPATPAHLRQRPPPTVAHRQQTATMASEAGLMSSANTQGSRAAYGAANANAFNRNYDAYSMQDADANEWSDEDAMDPYSRI